MTPIVVNPEYAILMSPTSALLVLRFLFGALQGDYLLLISALQKST
jgi:hypothetical protein